MKLRTKLKRAKAELAEVREAMEIQNNAVEYLKGATMRMIQGEKEKTEAAETLLELQQDIIDRMIVEAGEVSFTTEGMKELLEGYEITHEADREKHMVRMKAVKKA